MVAASTMEPRTSLRKQIEEADPDLLRELVRSFAEALMAAEVDVLNEAGYGERASGARIAATGAGAATGTACRHGRAPDAQARQGHVLPGAGSSPAA